MKLAPQQLGLPALSDAELVLEQWSALNSPKPLSLELSWKIATAKRQHAVQALRRWFERHRVPYFLSPPSRSDSL
jgi:hypothetical protein